MNLFRRVSLLGLVYLSLSSVSANAQSLCWPLISVAPGNESATISWEDVPGATGYNLYWGTSPDINTFNMFNMKVPLVTSPFKQTQLANGVKYYFIVQAISNKANSYGSNIVSATPAATATGKSDTIIIRPLGNSITYGIGFSDDTYCPVYANGQKPCPPTHSDWGGGYRGWMSLILNNNKNILYKTEGHQDGGSTQLQWQTSTQHHDGYPGYWTTALISKSLMPSEADITLLHAGTNDLYWTYVFNAWDGKDTSWSVQPFADSLFIIVNNLLKTNQKTKVYVAKIIRFFPGTIVLPQAAVELNAKVDQYNQLIENNWNALPADLKSRVEVVDMNSVLNDPKDYVADGVHPSRQGYLKMACAWIRVMNGIGLYPPDQCSCITTNAVINKMPQH